MPLIADAFCERGCSYRPEVFTPADLFGDHKCPSPQCGGVVKVKARTVRMACCGAPPFEFHRDHCPRKRRSAA